MFEIELFDKNRARKNSLGAFTSASVELGRWAGTASFTVPTRLAEARLALLHAAGTRCRILDDGEPVMSGLLETKAGQGMENPELSFTVSSDVSTVLQGMTVWPVPTASLSGQDPAYRIINAPLETVMKTIIRENADRLGLPVIVEPDQGRGPTVRMTFRFHEPLARMQAVLKKHNAVMDVLMDSAGMIRVEYRQGVAVKKPFDVRSGTVTDWAWEDAAPTLTRVVVGGDGEGAARRLVPVVDADMESQWGVIREGFVDARDVEPTDPDSVLVERGREALDEARHKTGVSLSIVSTPQRPYGGDYRLGDTITVKTNDSKDTITAPLTRLTITQDKDGRRVSPGIDTIETRSGRARIKITRMDRALANLLRR